MLDINVYIILNIIKMQSLKIPFLDTDIVADDLTLKEYLSSTPNITNENYFMEDVQVVTFNELINILNSKNNYEQFKNFKEIVIDKYKKSYSCGIINHTLKQFSYLSIIVSADEELCALLPTIIKNSSAIPFEIVQDFLTSNIVKNPYSYLKDKSVAKSLLIQHFDSEVLEIKKTDFSSEYTIWVVWDYIIDDKPYVIFQLTNTADFEQHTYFTLKSEFDKYFYENDFEYVIIKLINHDNILDIYKVTDCNNHYKLNLYGIDRYDDPLIRKNADTHILDLLNSIYKDGRVIEKESGNNFIALELEEEDELPDLIEIQSL
jgi:hypothetical protein